MIHAIIQTPFRTVDVRKDCDSKNSCQIDQDPAPNTQLCDKQKGSKKYEEPTESGEAETMPVFAMVTYSCSISGLDLTN